MKIVETIDIISRGDFPSSLDWRRACRHVKTAVKVIDWPHGSGKFTIYPQSGKKRGEGNGVVPIRVPCLKKLRELGWQVEQLPIIKTGVIETGDLDALFESKSGHIGFEWETGNVSSCHRAINKLLLTLKLGGLIGGFLVVPSDMLKVYLTDRVSNIGELRHSVVRIGRGTRSSFRRIPLAFHNSPENGNFLWLIIEALLADFSLSVKAAAAADSFCFILRWALDGWVACLQAFQLFAEIFLLWP